MSRDVLVLLHSNSRAIRSLSVAAQDGLSHLSAKPRPRFERARPDDAPGAGRLRMTREFAHVPVMLTEVVDELAQVPEGVIVDATVGGGGHAAALLEASSRNRLIGIDRDPEAIEAAKQRLAPFGARARLVRARFDSLPTVLAAEAPGEAVTGFLFDLGVSSRQLDEPERGFSYRFAAPLDMRMDPDEPLTADRIVNEWPEAELARLFVENGESRFARQIARGIVSARPLATTEELAETVRAALPPAARQRGGHPAKRVFQAVRIAVNGELDLLPAALEAAMAALAPGGRAVVIAYHSGEDRLVKRTFADAGAGWCSCPQGLPCVCGATPAVTVLTKGARLPDKAEVEANPRASSARLRVVQRLDTPWRGSTQSGEET